jgi:hypothetical protein
MTLARSVTIKREFLFLQTPGAAIQQVGIGGDCRRAARAALAKPTDVGAGA